MSYELINKTAFLIWIPSKSDLTKVSSILVLLSLVGCVTMPAGAGLNSPLPFHKEIPNKAWIGSVKITDASVENPQALSDSLRGNLKTYIKDSGCFRQFDSLPGKTSAEDLVLNFKFDRYEQKRSVHPAYFPLSIITMTMYIWFGGPISIDETNLSGSLEVMDGSGKGLLNVSSRIQDQHNVSIWSPDYMLPSGIKARSELIHDLLNKVQSEINNNTTK